MRKIAKFKIYSRCRAFLLNCPNKILKFKHTKWKFHKAQAKKNAFREKFYNFLLISLKTKSWERRKSFHKANLNYKRRLSQTFDGSIKLNNKSLNIKTAKLDRLKFLKSTLLKLEYRLDIILTRLLFFSNVYDARTAIKKELVLINGRPRGQNCVVSKGDIITIKNNEQIKTFSEKLIKNSIFIPFIEVDFYSSTIVITKDIKEIDFLDLSLYFSHYFNLSKLYTAIYKN